MTERGRKHRQWKEKKKGGKEREKERGKKKQRK